MIFSKLQIAGGAVAGALFGSVLTSVWFYTVKIPRVEESARVVERARLDAATNKAAEELRDAADKARFHYRVCRESGRVWSNGKGECLEVEAQ